MQQDIVIVTDSNASSPQDLHNFYFSYVAYLRTAYVWFHSAHVSSRGVSYSGDHFSLYPKIYGFYINAVDEAIEKGVAQVGIEIACPKEHLAAAAQIACCYPSPTEVSPTAIAATGLAMVSDIIQFLEEQFKLLDESSQMSLGLNDMIMSHANQIENFVYLLKQRVATEMEENL